MAKKKPTPKKGMSLDKAAKRIESLMDKSERERKVRHDWKNPGARIDEERFF